MKKLKWMISNLTVLVLFGSDAYAFKNNTFSIGIGYHSRNALNRLSAKADGSKSLLGVTSFPLVLQYDWNFYESYFVAPQLHYTLLPQEATDKSTKTTMTHILFPIGMNFFESSDNAAEWFVGPGIVQYSMKGKGGIKTLNNGTGTSSFAVPGREVKIRNITLNMGLAYNFSVHRTAFTLIVENAALSSRHTESLNLTYTYRFSEL